MVLYDYFRAATDEVASELVSRDPGALFADRSADALDLKNIDPAVALGKLTAFARGQDDLEVDCDLVSDPDDEGQWLLTIGMATRDTLAGITDAQLPDLAARWARIDEFAAGGAPDPADLQPVVQRIAALARRAKDTGDGLYCLCTL